MKKFNEYFKVNENVEMNVLHDSLKKVNDMKERLNSNFNNWKSTFETNIENYSDSYRGFAYSLSPSIEEMVNLEKESTELNDSITDIMMRIPMDDDSYDEIYEELENSLSDLDKLTEEIQNLHSDFENLYESLLKSEESINNIRRSKLD